MKLSKVVRRAIAMKRAIPQPPLPAGANSGFVRASDLPPPAPPSPEKLQLLEFLGAQPVAVIVAVGVVMYLGRGDYEDDFDLAERHAQLGDTVHSTRYLVTHLVNKIPFADYLESGLRRLTEMGMDVDRMLEE